MSHVTTDPHLRPAVRRDVRPPLHSTIAVLLLVLLAIVVANPSARAAARRLVTGAEIKDGTIASIDVKNRSLTGTDVKDGSIGALDVANGAIGETKLAIGAITASKIAAGAVGTAQVADGSITAGKLAAGAVPAYSAGTGLTLTGTRFAASGDPDPTVVAVAASGGEFTSIQAAIDSITDESTTNPYVVQVGPGVYTERITVPPFVSLRGSGEDATIIRAAGGATEAAAATVTTGGSGQRSTISHLSIDNTGSGAYAVALLAPDGTNSALHDVTLTTSTASTAAYPLLLDGYASVYAWDITISSGSNLSPTNAGVRIQGTSPGSLFLYSSEVTMSDGTNVRGIDVTNGGGALVEHSTISALNGTNAIGVRLGTASAYARVRWSGIEARSGSGTNAPIQTLGGTADVVASDLASSTDGTSYGVDLAAGTPTVSLFGSIVSGADDWLGANASGTIRATGSRLENGIGGAFPGLPTYTCAAGTNVTQAYATLNASCT